MASWSWSFSGRALRTGVRLSGQEELDVAAIAWGQGEVGKLGWREPGEGGVFVAGWFAGDRRGDEHDQEGGVGVGDAEVWLGYGFDVDAKFLGEFAAGCGFVGFVRFDFAAGEFPEAPVAFMKRTLADKQTVVSTSNRCDHARH
jgi:hypothetical protein